jgi:oxygen-independent coproporphyrinogen III oxidase
MEQQITFDASLIKRYDVAGPRYTSYPTAVQFHSGFDAAAYRQALATRDTHRPLSLYFHLPFCDTVCFYCACNKVVTKRREKAAPYLQRVHHEMQLVAAQLNGPRHVEQLHWGGGTPTFISHAEMRELMRVTRRLFELADDARGEYGIEIDPREVKPDTLAVLREIGFNRLSMGVQDFDPRVQQAVNRIQSEAETFGVLTEARRLGFRSISMDLIYGLPFQSVASFGITLDKVLAVQPDRLSVFNYAHLPELFKPQRRINAADLPSPQVKLEILQMTIARLTAAGYVYIGMDHFARPDDELAIAQRDGKLYRNFQGYSTHADCDLLGFGITSISSVNDCFAQNLKELDDYYPRIDANELPVFRGIALDADDRLRRDIIIQLSCHFGLDFSAIAAKHYIVFSDYFARELRDLHAMQTDGLLQLHTAGLTVLPAGRLLIRNICMVFDKYLRDKTQQRFSKVI